MRVQNSIPPFEPCGAGGLVGKGVSHFDEWFGVQFPAVTIRRNLRQSFYPTLALRNI